MISALHITWLKGIAKSGGITSEVVKDSLIEWYKRRCTTTNSRGLPRASIDETLMGNPPKTDAGTVVVHTNRATNGASMKIFPCGVLHPGDVDKAIDDAVIASLPTHDNDIAISGAAAVAAAVRRMAMTGIPR